MDYESKKHRVETLVTISSCVRNVSIFLVINKISCKYVPMINKSFNYADLFYVQSQLEHTCRF